MKKILLIAAMLMSFAALPAHAALQVDVTQGNVQPLPIAIPDFRTARPSDAQIGANIAGVIRADLERSGLFKAIDPKAFVDHNTDISTVPDFANWRVINAQGLVTGLVTVEADGSVQLEYRLWDVFAGQQKVGMSHAAPPADWRRIAHKTADEIYEQVTGEKGYFDTQIVFIAESGPATNRIKRLARMDEDGFNPVFLTNGSYMVLTPRFNPTAQMIAYMSYIGTKPRVYLFDIENGHQDRLGDFPNMTFSPRFSPDGNKVALSLENNGNSDIYVMDLRTRQPTRLTTDPAIDTAPSFSPDGKQIAFESDRGGGQQIYVMNADGSNQHRVSFGQGANGTPVWSPRGDYLAYTERVGNVFHIGVMHPDGSGARLISSGPGDEGPTWAPNGRVLMFGRTIQGGRGSEIWSVDVTGRNERKVLTPGDASDPAWSPLLQ